MRTSVSNMNINSDISHTATYLEVAKKLHEKSELIKQYENDIANFEEKIKARKEALKQISEEEMPALLDELGVSEVPFADGTKAYINNSIHVGIPERNKIEAFEWLRNNGHADLIKTELKVKFNRKENNLIPEVKAKLEEFGIAFDDKEVVNTISLKAFVKEQIREGNSIPNDLFGVYIRRCVEIK